MRIICESYRDYYDCIQAQGQDQSLVYLRTSYEFRCASPEKYPFPRRESRLGYYGRSERYAQAASRILGFCGKIYPLVHISKGPDGRYCYSLKELDDYIQKNFNHHSVDAYRADTNGRWWANHSKHWNFDLTRKSFVRFFEECERKKDQHMGIFRDDHCPIFLAHVEQSHYAINFNPQLKPLEFYRIFPPAEAFQEIAMFLGGLAVPLKPIPVPDDKDMVSIKGFDKHSFRKDPTSKKRRKNLDIISKLENENSILNKKLIEGINKSYYYCKFIF